MSTAAATAAQQEELLRQKEEEELTKYSDAELQGEWELKIVRRESHETGAVLVPAVSAAASIESPVGSSLEDWEAGLT